MSAAHGLLEQLRAERTRLQIERINTSSVLDLLGLPLADLAYRLGFAPAPVSGAPWLELDSCPVPRCPGQLLVYPSQGAWTCDGCGRDGEAKEFVALALNLKGRS